MKLLFYITKLYSVPIIEPLIRLIITQNDIEFKIYKIGSILDENLDPYQSYFITTLKEAEKFNPDFTLTPCNYVDFRLPGKKVQIFHGVGIEKKSHYEIRDFFDIYLTSGPLVTEKFIKLAIKYQYFKVFETGWLKFDHIYHFTKYFQLPGIKKDPSKKYILYAPTFSRKMESFSDLKQILPNIIKDNEVILFKFHELMLEKDFHLFKNIPENIINIPLGADITPYLYLADIMISDTSSVVYEFLALDKPVITYKTQSISEKGCNIEDKNHLRSALDTILYKGEYDYEKSREILQKVNPYIKGQVAANTIAILKSELGQKQAKKPLNLWRKIKILYRYYTKNEHLN